MQIPYQDNVKFFMHGNGNPTVSPDYNFREETGKTLVSVNGDCKNLTTQSKFNGSSLYFDGTGDFLVISAHNDFYIGTKDFTVSAFVFINGNSSADANGNKQAYTIKMENDSFHLLEILGDSSTTVTQYRDWETDRKSVV